MQIRWVFFPLHPDTPAEGLSLERLFAGRGMDIDAMHARMKRLMDAEAENAKWGSHGIPLLKDDEQK